MTFLKQISTIKGYILLGLLYLTLTAYAFEVKAHTATAPSSGNGTVGNPYQIASLSNLYWIYVDESHWDKHYILTANLNAAVTTSYDGDESWMPIGNTSNEFRKRYDSIEISNSGLSRNRFLLGHRLVRGLNYLEFRNTISRGAFRIGGFYSAAS